MDFSRMLVMQGSLFLIMIIGYWVRKSGIGGAREKKFLSDLMIHLTIPANIIKSFQEEIGSDILRSCMTIVIISVAIQIGCYILVRVAYRHAPDGRKQIMQYASCASNAGALGNAVAEGIFGDLGVLYASIYVIPQRIVMWSVGLTYFTEAPSKKELIKKIMTHPCIVSIFIGMGIMFLHIPVPAVIGQTLKSFSNSNTCLCMLLVGMILGEVDLRTVLDRDVAYYTAIRLGLIPLLIFIACVLFHVDTLASQVSIVLAGMPAPSATVALASKYNRDEVFATKCVVFSTLLSMVTVPIWCLLLIQFMG